MTILLNRTLETQPDLMTGFVTGLCCIELDNLDVLRTLNGAQQLEACLSRVEAILAETFAPQIPERNVMGTGFRLWLGKGDFESGLQLAFQKIAEEHLVTVRAGYAAYEAGLSAHDLISRAGMAALSAKIAKVPWLTYGAQTHFHERGLRGWAGLPQAMEQGQIILNAQEIVSVSERARSRARQYEVLMRVADAEGISYPLDAVLHHAERSYLIERLDRWMLAYVFMKHGKDLAARDDLNLSLNVSGRSISSPQIWPYLQELLDSSQMAPDRLQLEITETGEITDFDQARANVAAMRAAGMDVALDDFGAGHSGAFNLSILPVNVIKIDGALVSQLDEAEGQRADRVATILRSIINLAHTLGAYTVAEYASTPKIAALLTEMGVDKIQGFAVGRPVPLDDILAKDSAA